MGGPEGAPHHARFLSGSRMGSKGGAKRHKLAGYQNLTD